MRPVMSTQGIVFALVLVMSQAGLSPASSMRAERGARCHSALTHPEGPSPEHLGAAALPQTWQCWWRSHRRPATKHQTIRLNGRPVEVFTEALPPGWLYPCTEVELERQLRELSAGWTARLRSIRFTFHPEWEAFARTDRSRIEISYVVDSGLRAPGLVQGKNPEELRFGAHIEVYDGARRCIWPDAGTLRTYILRHILIHELGHHVAPDGLSREVEEAWAEAFAFRYYTPPVNEVAGARLTDSKQPQRHEGNEESTNGTLPESATGDAGDLVKP